jgi:HK97 family phage portal protein
MKLFGFLPTGMLPVRQREVVPTPIGGTTGVPTSTTEKGPTVTGGSFSERIIYAREPLTALTVSAVYRAVELRAKTLGVMPIQYRKKDFEKGNFMPDMRGLGKRINYLLQQEPNPTMSASSMWELVHINRLMKGNGFVYIERDEFGFPLHLWLVRTGAYNIIEGNYAFIEYLSDYGYVEKVNVPASDVLHFPNTYRYKNGIWGISTLEFALDTLALNKTLRAQALETAGKGGRVKLILSEGGENGGVAPIAAGRFDPEQVENMGRKINKQIYEQDVIAIQNLTDVKQISMTQAEMQAIEQIGMTDDDVARFYGTPRPLLMLDTNSHYNDYQNATMEYHTRTILPDANDEAKEIYRKLIGFEGYGTRDIHVCEKPLLAMDPERKAKYYESMLRTGIMTVNEMRAEEDMPSVDNGNIVYVLTNLAELGSAKLRDVAGGGRPTTQEPQQPTPPKEGEKGEEPPADEK